MSNTKKIKSAPTKNDSSTRPWQGTVLAVLNIIGLIFTAMFIPFAILIIVGGGMLSFMEDVNPIIGLLFGGGGLVFLFILLFFFILGVFVIRGLFKGRRWTIIVSLIFSILSLVGVVFDFSFFSLIVTSLFLYLEITCLMHPFYGNGKK